MAVAERFLRYVSFDTQSNEESQTVPSTEGQLVFARYLRDELKSIGMSDVRLDEYGYVYATLPAVRAESDKQDSQEAEFEKQDSLQPRIGFIAHMDTSPDAPGGPVRPRIIKNYDGGDIVLVPTGEAAASAGEPPALPERASTGPSPTLSPQRFPELLEHVGEDLIVTDGTTLLGADDKSGIAEIVEAMAWLKEHPEVAHGEVRVAFTPDEEIGRGAYHFDVEHFGCQWAYTMDGGDVGELEYENFNAASAQLTFHGVSVHPGYAKHKMVNAALVSTEFAAALPLDERPETTEDREGFFHITDIKGTAAHATLSLIIRDHDTRRFEERKKLISTIAARMNDKYGKGTVTVELHDQYRNMKEIIDRHPHVVDLALAAMQKADVTPRVQPIRGGTDGAQLSFLGLPCPNIFAGGLNFHGPYEYVSIQSMEKAVQVIINIVRR